MGIAPMGKKTSSKNNENPDLMCDNINITNLPF